MKRFAIILFLLCILSARAGYFDITNDTCVMPEGDSFEMALYGQRGSYMVGSYFICYNPTRFVTYRELSRSGGQNADLVGTRQPKYEAFQLNLLNAKTNVFQLLYLSGNGANTSNQMFGYVQKSLLFPLTLYDQAGNFTNDWPPGSSVTNYIQTVIINDPPYHTGDGQFGGVTLAYNAGGDAAGALVGVPHIDSFGNLSNAIFTASGGYPANSNLYFPNNGAFDHPSNDVQCAWALTTFTNAGVDSNTFTAEINFGAATIGSTNHCVVSGLSGTGSSVTFNLLADRMAPAVLVPDGITGEDFRGGLRLIPQLTNTFCEMLALTNLVNGTYRIVMDGNYAWTATAQNGRLDINLWNNYTNAFQAQASKIHYLLCDLMDVSPFDLSSDVHAGNQLWQNYRSICDTVWPTNTLGVASYLANPFILNNALAGLDTKDAEIHTAAQQTNHTFNVSLIPNRFFFFRIR